MIGGLDTFDPADPRSRGVVAQKVDEIYRQSPISLE